MPQAGKVIKALLYFILKKLVHLKTKISLKLSSNHASKEMPGLIFPHKSILRF